jgi:hypothetical protein
MDLLDQTRMHDTYNKLNTIIEQIGELDVFPPLGWVWSWDVAATILKDVMEGGDPEYCVTMDEEEMFELFWRDADKNGFSLEYGSESLYEAVRDWMNDEGIIEEYIEEEDEDDNN